MEMNLDGLNSEYYSLEEVKSRIHSNVTNLTPSRDNVESLKAIQKFILYYENKALSLDEVLTRVLDSYNEIVPYKD